MHGPRGSVQMLSLLVSSILALSAAAQTEKLSACEQLLGQGSPCCSKLEWLSQSPEAAKSECLPGGTVAECMLLATGRSLPYDAGLYNLCKNSVSLNVSAAYFLVSRSRKVLCLCCQESAYVPLECTL